MLLRSTHRPHRNRTARAFKAQPRLETLEARNLLNASPYLPPSYLLTNPTGLLSGPADGQPLDVALGFLNDHAADLGLTPADLSNPIVTSQYTDADSGTTHIYLRQQVNGLEVQYADLAVSLDAQNEVIAAGGGFVPGLAAQLTGAGQPAMSAVEAVQTAAAALNVKRNADKQDLTH
jgi:hypothetical protein